MKSKALTRIALGALLGALVATSAAAGVISVSAEHDADPGGIVVGDRFTIVFYAEDSADVNGILAATTRVAYDPEVLAVVEVIDNISMDQWDAP